MDAIASGLLLIVNGLVTVVQNSISWPVLLGLAGAGSLTWLAVLESDDLDRQGAKPQVVRH